MSPAVHFWGPEVLGTRTWIFPAPLASSHVTLQLLPCPQDTSHLSLHSDLIFFFFFGIFLAPEGKDGASAAENTPPRAPQGKAGERSSAFCSAGQFFFEYLVVVSLRRTPDGHYEPKITYQFPKVFSPVFLMRLVFHI